MFDATVPSDLMDNLRRFRLPEMRAGNLSDKDLQRAEGSCRILLSGSIRYFATKRLGSRGKNAHAVSHNGVGILAIEIFCQRGHQKSDPISNETNLKRTKRGNKYVKSDEHVGS